MVSRISLRDCGLHRAALSEQVFTHRMYMTAPTVPEGSHGWATGMLHILVDCVPYMTGFAAPIRGGLVRIGSAPWVSEVGLVLISRDYAEIGSIPVSPDAVSAAFAANTSRGDGGWRNLSLLYLLPTAALHSDAHVERYRAAVPCGRTDRVCFIVEVGW